MRAIPGCFASSTPLQGACWDVSLIAMNVLAAATTQEKPPFRAEHIGSLLRPKKLLECRERFARGEISQGELTDTEDTAIADAVSLQERIGLRFVTDGE